MLRRGEEKKAERKGDRVERGIIEMEEKEERQLRWLG